MENNNYVMPREDRERIVARRRAQEMERRNDYVSIFQRFNSLDEMNRCSQMLAASLFAPREFQGRPENCFIAIDLALSLGIEPTQILPHLYVINGRPALSAQFMISLVNRSNLFTRIRWEEGIDGDVEYDAYGKRQTMPNYYAVAYFTELATGETFSSIRVDLELARSNGWLGKNESKWRVMPQQMCRWRSAAWLVKNYCPEVVLGLEQAEEVADYDATPPEPKREKGYVEIKLRRDAAPNVLDVESEEVDETTLDELSDAIRNATSFDALKDAGRAVATSDLSNEDKARLRRAYSQRLAELTQGTSDAEPTQEEPTEEKPAPKRARKTTKKATSDEPTQEREQWSAKNEQAVMAAIRNAQTLDELTAIRDALTSTAQETEIDSELIEKYFAQIEWRERELNGDVDENPASIEIPTEAQKTRGAKIRDGLKAAQSQSDVEHWRKIAVDYLANGFINQAQMDALEQMADEMMKRFLA